MPTAVLRKAKVICDARHFRRPTRSPLPGCELAVVPTAVLRDAKVVGVPECASLRCLGAAVVSTAVLRKAKVVCVGEHKVGSAPKDKTLDRESLQTATPNRW